MVKRADILDVVVLMNLETEVRKPPASELDLPRAEIDAEAEARRNGVQEIGGKAADLQNPFVGRYNEAKKLENLLIVVPVLGNVVSAALACPLVMLADLIHPAFKSGGAKPTSGRGFGYRIPIHLREA